MEFNDSKPIYRQIIDLCFENVLSGRWRPDERIPSVRELAIALAVNSHTVLKAMDYLQAHDIIFPRRGMGYYLSADARIKVEEARRQDFFENRLESMFREMDMLGISIDEILAHWQTRTENS